MKKKFNPEIDYYRTLGIGQNFSEEDLKKAYRKRALETHPDVNSEKSSDAFREVGEAYEILSNPDLKIRYDFERTRATSSFREEFEQTKKEENSNSFEEFFKQAFREAKKKAREEFYRGQKEAYEFTDRAKQERAEKEAREKMKEKIRLNKSWREGIERVMPYIIRFPNLRDEFLNDDDWSRENFGYGFGRDGTLFYKDMEIFNSLLNDSKTVTGKEIYKLALETRNQTILQGRIPLRNQHIGGLELLATITSPTKQPYVTPQYSDFSFHTATIGFNYANVPYCMNDFRAYTVLPLDYQKPKESLMQAGNFIAHLNKQIREGNYSIGLSENVPLKHNLYKQIKQSYSLRAHGFWIESLSLGKSNVIVNGEVVNLPTELPLIG